MNSDYIGTSAKSFADYVNNLNPNEMVGCEIHIHTSDGGYFMTGFGEVPPPIDRIVSLAAELAALREKLISGGVI